MSKERTRAEVERVPPAWANAEKHRVCRILFPVNQVLTFREAPMVPLLSIEARVHENISVTLSIKGVLVNHDLPRSGDRSKDGVARVFYERAVGMIGRSEPNAGPGLSVEAHVGQGELSLRGACGPAHHDQGRV